LSDDLESYNRTAQCRQVDIYPTVLNLLGVDFDENEIDGKSLDPPERFADRPAYIRSCGTTLRGRSSWSKAIRHGGYKYVEYPERDWSPELYDLSAHPSELRLSEETTVSQELRQEFPNADLESTTTLDNEDHLRDLGYL
jgi:arylsulfatase A-like enzyme